MKPLRIQRRKQHPVKREWHVPRPYLLAQAYLIPKGRGSVRPETVVSRSTHNFWEPGSSSKEICLYICRRDRARGGNTSVGPRQPEALPQGTSGEIKDKEEGAATCVLTCFLFQLCCKGASRVALTQSSGASQILINAQTRRHFTKSPADHQEMLTQSPYHSFVT